MLLNHPGSWQQFQFRSDNRGLSIMEMKSKYLHEQYLFEAQIQSLNQIHQQNAFMNGGGGGPVPISTPEPPVEQPTLRLRSVSTLASFSADMDTVTTGVITDVTNFTQWNTWLNTNFTSISVIDDEGGSQIDLIGWSSGGTDFKLKDNAFNSSTDLALIDDSQSNIINVIGEYTFSGCRSLTDVNLRGVNRFEGEGQFVSCISLTTMTMPLLTSFGSVDTFYGCSSLTSVNFPLLDTLYYGAFSECASLTDIIFGANISTIPAYAFLNCPLTMFDTNRFDTTFPNVTTIDTGAFKGSGFTTIVSSTVSSINSNAFQDSALTEISFPGEVTYDPTCFTGVGNTGTAVVNINNITSDAIIYLKTIPRLWNVITA